MQLVELELDRVHIEHAFGGFLLQDVLTNNRLVIAWDDNCLLVNLLSLVMLV